MHKSVKTSCGNEALKYDESRSLSVFQILLIASRHPHNSLLSNPSLLIHINVLKHLEAKFNDFKPFSKLQNVMVSFLAQVMFPQLHHGHITSQFKDGRRE